MFSSSIPPVVRYYNNTCILYVRAQLSLGKLLYTNKNGDISLLVQPYSILTKAENKFINIPQSYQDFEIYTNYPDTEQSRLLKKEPENKIDKIARKMVRDSMVVTSDGITIVFPPGLELNSLFGPMHVYAVLISKEDFDPIAEHLTQNPDVLSKSVLGKELIKLSNK